MAGFFHHSRRAVLGRRRSHCVDPSTSCLSYANENPQKSLPKRLVASTYVQKYITALNQESCNRIQMENHVFKTFQPKKKVLRDGSTYLLLVRPVTVAKLILVQAVLSGPGFPYHTMADLDDFLNPRFSSQTISELSQTFSGPGSDHSKFSVILYVFQLVYYTILLIAKV